MGINIALVDGVVKSLALRFDAQARPELRFTLVQTDQGPDGQPWVSYWPCCASGATAERLAGEIEEGQHVLVSSGKLCYRKRTTKLGEQSRVEVLVWTVSRLAGVDADPHEMLPESLDKDETSAFSHEAPEPGPRPKARKRAVPKHLQREWNPASQN